MIEKLFPLETNMLRKKFLFIKRPPEKKNAFHKFLVKWVSRHFWHRFDFVKFVLEIIRNFRKWLLWQLNDVLNETNALIQEFHQVF